ncbi:DUF1476 domain-containing protein [Sandarakinorhabdus oryzae]|uniref:DUF1476 domain-containing protein n=1 Tax=Sandarakinorhabdus oryzae TaxID=2675220 RepID=UPI0012E1B578|nr:DUF1476 domain-containing protein [Sandarakinorhabdus oryzae]
MTTFDSRENAFENKFAHDAETRFRILARRDKLIGLWAAAKLGKEGAAAEDYAKTVVLSDLETPGDDDIIAKLHGDLSGLGVGVNDIKAMLLEKLAQAEHQISGDA